MTAREFFGCVGLLGAVFVSVTNCTPAEVQKAERTIDKVEAVVKQARDAGDASCDVATPACATYYGAVTAGLVREDDRAELACAKASNLCALLGSAGAP